MKVLLSAYACEPGKGSEPEVGLRVMLAAAERHEVWVLTRENNVFPLSEYLATHPSRERIHIEGLDVTGTIRRLKPRGHLGLHAYYEAWQQRAGAYAVDLDRRVDFDVVHHATFATYWTRAGVSRVDKPFVWGPVGGGVSTPGKLLSELGPAGLREDLLRETVRRLSAKRPNHRHTVSTARAILAQNPATARLIRSDFVSVLPNALTVGLQPGPETEPRGTEVAFVGRLTPWKGGVLAVRTMRYVRHPGAVLSIYGEGPDRGRISKAIERWKLAGRVRLVGNLPRDELLSRVRRAGVLLHPALHDESPIALGEALSLGVPVVCLDHGGPAEVTRWWPDQTFALVRPGDPEDTARRLAAAVDAFLERPSVIPSGIARPRTTFSGQLLLAYESAVSGP
jgi:glycosyltransferase involved in cell wall biosynthesis